jgi:hypothetical protein
VSTIAQLFGTIQTDTFLGLPKKLWCQIFISKIQYQILISD